MCPRRTLRRTNRAQPTSMRTDGIVHLHATEPDAAEQAVTEALLVPHRLRLPGGGLLNMELVVGEFGSVRGGLLSYGTPAHVSVESSGHILINRTVQGRAATRNGNDEWLVTRPGECGMFDAQEALEIKSSATCQQLSLVVERTRVERELEKVIGRTTTRPLQIESPLADDTYRLVGPALEVVEAELRDPTGLATQPIIGRHLEGLILDAVLLAQPHNFSEELRRQARPGSEGAVARAVELMEEQPTESWTIVGLASEAHVSVRALQYGFKRHLGTTPMDYLRRVRLRRARQALLDADPGATTVRDVALGCGFMHMSRFATAYREAFGEVPSATLARPPS